MKAYANNNRAERLNGTLRERTKVSRGWKTGITPAEASGIKIEGENKWITVIQNASKNGYDFA